jgi:spoIIIJ-associated protein
MEPIEIEGKTVDEAIEKAVQLLNAPKEELTVEVIANGSQSLFGLISSKKARIKASVLQDPLEERKEQAQKHLEEILRLADIPASVEAEVLDEKIFLTINGDGSGLLIGKRGQTLDALQYLVNKMVNRHPKNRVRVIVDTENYRNRREAKLVSIAHRLGDRAQRQRTSVATGPLNPQERRVIYLALQNNPDLSAKSEGEGKLKRVVIMPRRER